MLETTTKKVKTLTTGEDLGGAMLHCSVSGIVDYFAADESESFDVARDCVESLNLKSTSETSFDVNIDKPVFDVEELDVLGGLDVLSQAGDVPH